MKGNQKLFHFLTGYMSIEPKGLIIPRLVPLPFPKMVIKNDEQENLSF